MIPYIYIYLHRFHIRNSTPLRRWFAKQRTEYKKIRAGEESALTTQRLQLLNDIDFQFEPTKKSKSWEDRFQELVEFKEKVRRDIVNIESHIFLARTPFLI